MSAEEEDDIISHQLNESLNDGVCRAAPGFSPVCLLPPDKKRREKKSFNKHKFKSYCYTLNINANSNTSDATIAIEIVNTNNSPTAIR